MNKPLHLESLKILLAEDSHVNQQFAVALLKAEGHDVTVACTGREAVDAHATESFDLILMDTQMPEMDGMEAAALIRSREKAAGMHVPIIGMTARTLDRDRQHCLAAGMDGCIHKPIQALDLFAAIQATLESVRWLAPEEAAPPDVATVVNAAENADENDLAELMHALQETPVLSGTVASAAADEVPQLVSEIRQAVEHEDADKLRRVAHTLKGSLGYFGDTSALMEARRMEEMGKSSAMTAARASLESLEGATRRIVRLLKEHACGKTPVAKA